MPTTGMYEYPTFKIPLQPVHCYICGEVQGYGIVSDGWLLVCLGCSEDAREADEAKP